MRVTREVTAGCAAGPSQLQWSYPHLVDRGKWSDGRESGLKEEEMGRWKGERVTGTLTHWTNQQRKSAAEKKEARNTLRSISFAANSE
ncbi:hypothetical protein EVAR_8066_1 [Eumeta japonica]|uniref:Uncharacterized protein n=1 Tax=Eumeta variegata TaxID=151549 RepID=A0A4C1TI50_EUMVA|nr:hypothetical protein EVAR_8066_1 [Eumeta japonica]